MPSYEDGWVLLFFEIVNCESPRSARVLWILHWSLSYALSEAMPMSNNELEDKLLWANLSEEEIGAALSVKKRAPVLEEIPVEIKLGGEECIHWLKVMCRCDLERGSSNGYLEEPAAHLSPQEAKSYHV